jgi:hypothetical protein
MRELCHLNNRNLFRLLAAILILILLFIVYNLTFCLTFCKYNTANLAYKMNEISAPIDPDHFRALARPADFFLEYDRNASNLTFDEHCDQHGEWSSIGNLTYIKRTGVFFFADLGLLRAHILRRGDKQASYSVNLTIYRRVKLKNSKDQFKFVRSIFKQDTHMWHSGSSSKYFYNVISVHVNLTGLDLKNLRMLALFQQKETKMDATHPVNVKIKSLSTDDYASRKGTLVCSKVTVDFLLT